VRSTGLSLFFLVSLFPLAAGCGSVALGAPDSGTDGGVRDERDSGTDGAAIEADAETREDASHDAAPDARPPLGDGLYEVLSLEMDADITDLAPLGTLVGDADVVSFGETVHFSYGYARARARLIRYAIEHLGFRGLAFEGNWVAAFSVDAYVKGEATIEEAIDGLNFETWRNRPTVDLLSWIRTFNEAHPGDPVTVFGMDTQNPANDGLQIRLLADALVAGETLDADAAGAIRDGLRACPGAWQASLAEAEMDPVDGPILLGTAVYFDERFDTCNATLDAIAATFASVDAELDARQRAFVHVALTSLRAFQAEIYYYVSDPVRSYEVRDAAAADTFLTLRALLAPGLRVALFAHNWHIERNSTDDTNWSFESTGTHLAHALGDGYAPIGLFAANVFWNWPDAEIDRGEAHPASLNSIESVLDAYERDYLLVDLEVATAEGGVFDPDRRYEMGHDEIATARPLSHYRGIFFLHESEETPDDGGF
jgi:erythromycin esterase-like protein